MGSCYVCPRSNVNSNGNNKDNENVICDYCKRCMNALIEDNNSKDNLYINEENKKTIIILEYKISNNEKKIRLFGEKFFKNNKDKCKMLIDFSLKDISEFYELKENKTKLNIKLEIEEEISDISYMFNECTSLVSVNDFSDLNRGNITNISYLFSGCSSLEKISDFPKWNTGSLTDISYAFSECSKLKNIPDISDWNTNNVINMSHLFYGCSSLTVISEISKWKLKKIKDMSYLFYGCYSLEQLPDISRWEIKNSLVDISYLFFDCYSLKSLPDISKWDTKNVTNMSYLFYGSSSIEKIPDISEWNTENVTNMKSLFSFLSSVKSLPDISKWNTINVVDMSNMFYGCSLIQLLPDINRWSTENVSNLSYIFCQCSSLITLPDISSWKTDKVKDMSYMFYDCLSLASMPDISIWYTNNVTNMSYMFYNCSTLQYFPMISKWKTNNVRNMSYMFYNCFSLKYLDDISEWNTNKLKEIDMIFYNCSSLNTLPDISKWKCYKEQNRGNNIININERNNKEKELNEMEKIEIKGDIDNSILTVLPQILLKFNEVDNFDENLLFEIRKEIKKLLKNDNFSIIKLKKGSLSVVITLQYLLINQLKNVKNAVNFSNSFFKDISDEVEKCANVLQNHNFVSLGTTNPRPDIVDKEVIDITNESKREELSKEILKITGTNNDDDNNNYNNINNQEVNIMESAKNIKMEDLEKYIEHISLKANEQEKNIKKFIKKGEKYNELFDEEIEITFKKSVFEYTIVHILAIDKDDTLYQEEKAKCPNIAKKILFHGTNVNAVTGVLSNQFYDAKVHIFGKGVYFTDILDYAWYYAGEVRRKNFNNIPKVGDTFTCVASEIYYDKEKIQKVYNTETKDKPVEKNGIRCAFADYNSTLMNLNYLREYKGFIGNEYLITDKSQIIPIYGVTFKRVEYLVIWRDYNLNINNPNKYDYETFQKMQEFHRKIRKYVRREFNSRIYFIETTEEALELLDRKKYNKTIVITNGNNDGEGFIKRARQIIGSNAIAAVTAYDVGKHINWVKNMDNVLILNDMNFHEKFLDCIKYNDKNKYNQLRNEIVKYYKQNIDHFELSESTSDLFEFPKFKNEGYFENLKFGINYNEADLNVNIIKDENMYYY